MAHKQKRRSKSHGITIVKKPAGSVPLPEGVDMSNRLRRDLKVLKDSIAEHTRTVEERLSKDGTSAQRTALVASAAKYYPTLKRLAEK